MSDTDKMPSGRGRGRPSASSKSALSSSLPVYKKSNDTVDVDSTLGKRKAESDDKDETTSGKKKMGRPKGDAKLDQQYRKQFDKIITSIGAVKKALKGKATDDDLMEAVRDQFDDDGTIEFEDRGGDGILAFLNDEKQRNEEKLKGLKDAFEFKLAAMKDAKTFDKEMESMLSKMRRAEDDKLAQFEQFLDVASDGLAYFKKLFAAEKSATAQQNQLILTALQKMKDELRAAVMDTSRYASAQSQEMDDFPEDE